MSETVGLIPDDLLPVLQDYPEHQRLRRILLGDERNTKLEAGALALAHQILDQFCMGGRYADLWIDGVCICSLRSDGAFTKGRRCDFGT